jgi:hypothetical protein
LIRLGRNLTQVFIFVFLSSLLIFSFTLALVSPSSDLSQTAYTPIKKVAIIYGHNWNSQDTTYIAANFNLLIVDFNGSRVDFHIPYAQYMSDLRGKSSSIQIFGYKDLQYMLEVYDDWAYVNAHEEWFVHDDAGHRIINIDWGTYLMDVGNAGWRQHWVNYVNNKLNDCPAYNGVFADNVWDSLYLDGLNYSPNEATISRWHTDTLGMLNYVKSNLAMGKLLILNTEAGWAHGHTNSDYLNVADGMLIEGYFHAPWEDSDSYTKIIESQIDCLASGSANGKIMIAESGSTSNDERILKWSYATFLLGINGPNTYWGWNVGSYYTFDSKYHSIMDTNIGSATGNRYPYQNVIMRDFTGGKVISNPTGNPATIFLGFNFWFLNNTPAFIFTIPAYSGEIILNAPLPTPTVSASSYPTNSIPVFPTFSPSSSSTVSPSPTVSLSPSPGLTFSPSSSSTVSPSPTVSLSPSSSLTPSPSYSPAASPSITPGSSTISDYQIALIILFPISALVSIVAIKRKKLPWLRLHK